MKEKIRTEKELWSGGMMFGITVETENTGSGDNAFPTRVAIYTDCSGNPFEVRTGINENGFDFTIRGEWEAMRYGDMFIWIGEEINRQKKELGVI